ncbi:MAG: hypothetical protein H0X17_10190, partial [Deltaproteobacteria bacterium]|nr:hypothetical protein [Deltaproteobacteria bacterium]
AAPMPAAQPVAAEPTVVAQPAATPLRVTYDRGISFATDDGTFAIKLAFRNQLRFETSRQTEEGSQFQSHFLIPRSRLQVDGNGFGKGTRYKLELGLGDAGSFAFVKELFVDQRLGAGPAWLRAGVWRRPFNRQELVADFASELNERAITATFVGGGRDLGIGVHNEHEKSPEGLEWAVGVFNGFSGGSDRPQLSTTCTENAAGAITCTTRAPTNVPTDFGPTVVARAGWNRGGIKGYSEGDLEGGPLRLAVGASYKIDLANFAEQAEASVAENLSHGVQADAMLKIAGLSVQLGLYLMKLKSADARYGALVQGGYFVMPKRVQLALRFAVAPPTPLVGDREQLEARVAFNLFWQGHAFKWATDVGILQLTGEDPTTMASDEPELQLRSMLQLML